MVVAAHTSPINYVIADSHRRNRHPQRLPAGRDAIIFVGDLRADQRNRFGERNDDRLGPSLAWWSNFLVLSEESQIIRRGRRANITRNSRLRPSTRDAHEDMNLGPNERVI
jgi:hypothetical protein